MPLEKVERTSGFLRIRRFIMGKEKPDLLTRISVIVGFLVWIYLFSWHLLTFLSIIMMGTLKQPQIIKAAFQRVGSREYGFADSINRLLVYSIIEMAVYGIILIGLILIYRKKRLGFLCYILGFPTTFLITFFVMGYHYMKSESSWVDFLLILFGVVYFTIGLFIFYRKPKTNKATV